MHRTREGNVLPGAEERKGKGKNRWRGREMGRPKTRDPSLRIASNGNGDPSLGLKEGEGIGFMVASQKGRKGDRRSHSEVS